MKNSEFSERLMQVIENEKEKISTFSKKMGYGDKKNVYDVLNKGILPSFEFFYLFILSEYSEKYDLRWLITGDGKMLRNYSEISTEENEKITKSTQYYEEMNSYLLKRVKELEEELSDLKDHRDSDDAQDVDRGSYKKTGN